MSTAVSSQHARQAQKNCYNCPVSPLMLTSPLQWYLLSKYPPAAHLTLGFLPASSCGLFQPETSFASFPPSPPRLLGTTAYSYGQTLSGNHAWHLSCELMPQGPSSMQVRTPCWGLRRQPHQLGVQPAVVRSSGLSKEASNVDFSIPFQDLCI